MYRIVPEDYLNVENFEVTEVNILAYVATEAKDMKPEILKLDYDSIAVIIFVDDEIVYGSGGKRCPNFKFLHDDIKFSCDGEYPNISHTQYENLYFNYEKSSGGGNGFRYIKCSYYAKLIKVKH